MYKDYAEIAREEGYTRLAAAFELTARVEAEHEARYRSLIGHLEQDVYKRQEKKFVKDGREVLYLANSGELTAIFVLSYAADPDIVDELGVLVDRDIGISVYTTDSNITPQKISELFDFPEDMVEIVPYKLHGQCDRLMAHKDRARAEIVYNGSLASKAVSYTHLDVYKRQTSFCRSSPARYSPDTTSRSRRISSCSWHRYSSAAMVLVVMFDHPFRLQGAPGQTSVSPVPLL